ncbi:hypothetical protein BS50DRAFT_553982 [Corynespora cassiicola Philippines]|uniref:Uncharacterized protein n=1 Tax=Corynespora cassiicola Philippines TaxID=1448308 RepID=A0A2T2NKI8_CORCC|nr:hypothetical protein BS50DRAFT_553982 [Corynespora cassiicola Philippines]
MAPGIDLSSLASEVATANDTTLPTKKPAPSPTTIHSTGSNVLDPSLITQDFDQLRFHGAALNQLAIPPPSSSNPQLSTHLISSPYNNPQHYLDLTTLPLPSVLLAKALTALHPSRPDYATAPYPSALNFAEVLELVRRFSADEGVPWREASFYVVVFRSQLKAVIDNDYLYAVDYESHREACESGGLLKYWFGKPDGERRNLATCFWHSREDARKGGLGPWHKKARAAGRELYESIIFSVHRFTILDGATEYKFEDWKD